MVKRSGLAKTWTTGAPTVAVMGNNLMALGCLIMLVPILLIGLVVLWAIHPAVCIGFVVLVVTLIASQAK